MKTNNKKMPSESIFANRQHPIKILSYTTRSFWLILIPLARDLFASRYSLAQWLYGSWLSIVTIFAIFGWAFARWLTVTFRIEEDCIVAKSGYFGIFESKLYYSRLACVSSRQGAILRLFRASTMYLTTAGSDRALKLTLSGSDTRRLLSHITQSPKSNSRFCFVPKKTQLILFSLLFSSSLSGIIITLTFLFQLSRIIGTELERNVKGSIYELSEKTQGLIRGIPPVLSAAALIIIAAKAISFVVNLFRHLGFSITRQGGRLIIESGFITKRLHILQRESIVFSDSQQSLVMKWLRLCSVRIYCNGYGKKNKELNVLIPITTTNRIKSSVRLLVPEIKSVKKQISPPPSSVMSFILLPLVLAVLFPAAALVSTYFFPDVKRLAWGLVTIPEIMTLWLLAVKSVSLFTTGIGVSGELVRLDLCKGFSFHTVTIPTYKIAKITIRQSPFQRVSGKCSLRLSVCAPTHRSHKIAGLYLSDALPILKETGHSFVNSDRF